MTESLITKPERFEALVRTWESAYLVTLKSERNFRKRLKELQTWDNCNGHNIEHSAKVNALMNLLP